MYVIIGKQKLIFMGAAVLMLAAAAWLYLMISANSKVELAAKPEGETPFTIVLDPGHGGMDSGSLSQSGLYEKDINLAISLYLREMLRVGGFHVVMTRESDESIHDAGLPSISAQKRSDLKNRLEIMKTSADGIFLSVHQNSFTQSQYSGAQVFYHKQDSRNEILATILQKNFIRMLQPDNTRVQKQCRGEYYLLSNADRPAVLIECGFLSNKGEAMLLGTPEYQKQVAFVIFTSVLHYYVLPEAGIP